MQSTNIKWNALIKAIRDEKCILCIGPGVFTNREGEVLDKQVLDFLKGDCETDNDIAVYPDGLFYFREKHKRSHILADLERFYSKSFPNAEKIFKKLVHIPFNLVILLTPDNNFMEASILETRPFKKDFYFKGNPPKENIKPSKEKPMVYHLLGSLNAEADESVILTYDDLFDFLKSIFEGGSMSEELKSLIHDARHFVCLGLPFEKWYMQLLLRVLEMHINDDSTKYASVINQDSKYFDVYKEQFKFTIIPTDIDEFVDELLSKCKIGNLIRAEQLQNAMRLLPVENVQALISEDRLEDAFDFLELELKNNKKWGANNSNEFSSYRGQYKMLKRQKNNDIISNEEFTRGLAKIRTAILDFANEELKQ